MAGLFEGEELDGEAVGKTRESKIAFLEKAINFLGIYLNTHCSGECDWTAPRALQQNKGFLS